MHADDMLRNDVLAELSYDPRLRGADIAVAVTGGAAVLSGSVRHYGQKAAAEHAAQRVRGIRAVGVQLRVAPPPETRVDDGEIAKRIANLLAWSAGVPREVSAIVDQGWVTLSGSVEWNYQRQNAERLMRGLDGVFGVFNNIVVKPNTTSSDIHERIEAAIVRDARLDASAIDIGVTGSVVALAGNVATLHERTVAENAAWAAPGVTEVRNEIVVG